MLNEMQKKILEAFLEFPLGDIEESRPTLAIKAFTSILRPLITPEDEKMFDALGVSPAIKQIREILEHKYPQNRSTGDSSVGQDPGFAVWQPNGHGNGVAKEPLGLLSLTNRNDSTTPHVTKEDVVSFIMNEIKERTEKIRMQLQKQFHEACEAGKLAEVTQLLKEGVDPNCKGNYGFRPIHRAAINGNTKVVKMLVSAGCNLNAKNDFGDTPVHWAAWMGNTSALDYITSKGGLSWLTELNDKGKSPLMGAIRGIHVDTIAFLLDHKAFPQDISIVDQASAEKFVYTRLLFQAIEFNKPEIVKQCLLLGADIHNRPDLLLYLALSTGNTGIVRILLSAGIDVNAQDENQNTALMRYLLETVGWTSKYHEGIKAVLEYSPLLNIVNRDSDTALDIHVSAYAYLYHPDTNPDFITYRDKTLEALLDAQATTNKKQSLVQQVSGLKTSNALSLLQQYFSSTLITSVNQQEIKRTGDPATKKPFCSHESIALAFDLSLDHISLVNQGDATAKEISIYFTSNEIERISNKLRDAKIDHITVEGSKKQGVFFRQPPSIKIPVKSYNEFTILVKELCIAKIKVPKLAPVIDPVD